MRIVSITLLAFFHTILIFSVIGFSEFIYAQSTGDTLQDSTAFIEDTSDIGISQISIDGHDERVELTNYSAQDFMGSISLFGVKSSGIASFDVQISAGLSIIVGDLASVFSTIPDNSILNQGFVIKDVPDGGLLSIGLSVNNAPEIISIITEDLLKKHNEVASSLIYNNSKQTREIHSFEEIEPDEIETNTVSVASGVNSSGSGSGVSNQIILPETATTNNLDPTDVSNNDGTTIQSAPTNNQLLPLHVGDISMLEIYPHDTDAFGEYILLQYMVDITSPYILMGGARSGGEVLIDTCPGKAGDIIILTDSPEKISPHSSYIICTTNSSLSLADAGEYIGIYDLSGAQISSYTYPALSKKSFGIDCLSDAESTPYPYSQLYTSVYNQNHDCTIGFLLLDDDKINLSASSSLCESTYLQKQWSITQGGIVYNDDACDIEIDSSIPYLVNWKVLPFDNAGKPICDVSFGMRSETQELSDQSEEDTIDKNLAQEIDSSSGSQLSPLTLTEIYPYDTDDYQEYIEIFANEDYAGEITIQGLGNGASDKSFNIDIQKYQSLLITDDQSVTYTNAQIASSITLTNTGEQITLLGQDGHVIDKVVYEGGSSTSSLGFGGTIDEEGYRIFSQPNTPSPGFSSYFVNNICEQTKPTSCSLTIQGSTTSSRTSSINYIVNIDNDEISNAHSEYNCQRYGENLPDDFDYNSCNPRSFRYLTGGIHEVDVEIYRHGQYFCTIEYSLNLPEKATDEICLEEYYDDIHADVMESIEINVSESGESNIVQEPSTNKPVATQKITYREDLLSLISVLPNPKGADSDKEGIEIENITDETVNLEDVFIDNGKSRISLFGTILPGEKLSIYQKLGLYNSPSCIRVRQGSDVLLGELCYPKPKDDIRYSANSLTVADLSHTAWQSDISISQDGADICVQYNDESLFCKPALIEPNALKEIKSELKKGNKTIKALESTIKKLSKKEISLNKKILKEKETVVKQKGYVQAQKDKRKADKLKASEALGKQKEKAANSLLLVKLHEEFIYETLDRLRGPRQPIYEETNIDYLYTHRREIQKEFDAGVDSFEFGGSVVSRDELVLAYKIRTQTVGLGDMPIVDLYGPVLRSFRDSRQQTKDNMMSNMTPEQRENYIADYNKSIFDDSGDIFTSTGSLVDYSMSNH